MEFLGFLIRFFHVDANMKHLMEPRYVAKYVGFMKAKGLAASTINKVVSQLGQATDFVASKYCPHTPLWDHEYIEGVRVWYTNIVSKWHATKSSEKKHSKDYLSLWEAWELVGQRWTTFKAKHKVGWRAQSHE